MLKILRNYDLFRFCTKPKLNYYEILEVSPTASIKQIKNNYHKLAKIYHPDVYKGKDQNKFKLIQEAYQTLKNQLKRKEYDLKSKGINPDVAAEEQQKQEETSAPEDSNIGEKFSFKDYKSKTEGMRQDDFAQEYQEFMSKPLMHKPEDAVVYENIYMRQQSKEYKQQVEFMVNRQSKEEKVITAGYEKQVRAFIRTCNAQLQELRSRPADYHIKKDEQRYKRIRYGFIFFLLFTFPIIQSGLERRRKIQKQMEDDYRAYKEMMQELENAKTRSTFVY